LIFLSFIVVKITKRVSKSLQGKLKMATPSAPPSGPPIGLQIENYTDKSIVIRGETRTYKDAIKALGGLYNKYNGTPGWMFPKTQLDRVNKYLQTGVIEAPPAKYQRSAAQEENKTHSLYMNPAQAPTVVLSTQYTTPVLSSPPVLSAPSGFVSRADFDRLQDRVAALEQYIMALHKISGLPMVSGRTIVTDPVVPVTQTVITVSGEAPPQSTSPDPDESAMGSLVHRK